MRDIDYKVAEADDGRKISHVVKGRIGISHGLFASIKMCGCIMLNSAPVMANHLVHTGDTITIRLRDDDPEIIPPDEGPVNIVYMDEDIMIIDKQAPLACQRSPRQPPNALENRLAHRFAGEAFVFRPVNRLDKGTSGLMMAALHPHAQKVMQAALHTPDFEREYLAILCGILSPISGTIAAPIGKAEGATICRVVVPDGKPSITHYETIRAHGGLSLVRLRLETGRTHQIRVHAAHMGCPVLGDFLYGTEDARLPGRFALHSAAIRFKHPINGDAMAFTSQLPESLNLIRYNG